MKREFQKVYQPQELEKKWYDSWQETKIYNSSSKSTKTPYSILMPPPNVTGILHFGHVLNITLQDLYIRWKRMNGYEVCWFPGTDHAGIATQTKVEKELLKENLNRNDIGREKFLERVWDWKNKYGAVILKQMRYLGVSCDWDKTLFTMDESASNAVRQVFIRLFDEGLIYKGKRIINWSPLAQTALSDEEVEFKEVKEHLYTLKYYFENSSEYLKVATVRPETIFGDVAIAVNPEDERFTHLVGKKVIIPLTNRAIPIITDNYADPKFGTGCVKITPAHDTNDFEVGLRHNLEVLNSFNPDATLNELAGEFSGLDRFVARKKIVANLKELELIEKIEDYTHNVGFSQRGGEAIEPYVSSQWFVDMKTLAAPALELVRNGKINFYPAHFTKIYEHWMENIRDWCISRQLWWGHRIPVYYAPDGRFTAAKSEDEAKIKLGLDSNVSLEQDPDVLDTWFSSWLWPLTTMRWLFDGKTEDTEDLLKFLPTDLLVTAPDIIFFWVARMIMVTSKFKNEIPFKDVYFTSTIRDGKGQKLSKSLGNSPDPINIIDKYGADAIRFTIIFLSPLGQDIKMDVNVEQQDIPSMEIGRNFANKIWNASRLIQMKAEQFIEAEDLNQVNSLDDSQLSLADKWILSRLHSTIKSISNSLDSYRVDEYSKTLYDFIWRDFCDWWLEIFKIQLNESQDNAYSKALIKFALNIFDNILKLLHPVMPFITEEIYHILNDIPDEKSISTENSPVLNAQFIAPEIEQKFELFQLIIEEIRRIRANAGIAPSQKVPLFISCKDSEQKEFFAQQEKNIQSLVKTSELNIGIGIAKPENSLSSVVREIEIFIQQEAMDMEKERERLNKEIERLEKNIQGSEKKLSNESFVSKAPENIISYEREKLASMKESLEKLKAMLVD
ncbi:MAG TPA: valine--tRNA ligase [Candidatus Kapabacteria bacterium]|nr:valine--tRNA ligase [Candidatus Kapabacteria bacterium]HPO61853.1 valine--tRNA ligase [Candidatus Kapabacteria bacterium]